MKQPSIKTKLTFNELLLARAKGETISMKKIMKRGGFADATCINPEANLTSRPGWKFLMDSHFDDEAIAREIRSIAFDEGDKRAKLAAIDMMLKLKGKYPTNKLRLEGANSELLNILNVDETTGNEISEGDQV